MNRPILIPKLPPGHRIGEYEVLSQISEGGQGRVYLSRRWNTGLPPAEQVIRRLSRRLTPAQVAAYQLCVIKVPHPESKDNLRDEHAFLSDPAIDHPRVIQLYRPLNDAGKPRAGQQRGLAFDRFIANDGSAWNNHPCLILAYESGGSVRDLMRRNADEPLPPGVAVQIARQVAEALHHLHTVAGIVHHDISPNNIVLRRPLNWLLPSAPDCVVVDFAAADSTRYTRKREILGQRRYLAPERQNGADEPAIAPPPDIYSLGVVLYELLAGRAAIPTGRVTDEVKRPAESMLPPLNEHAPRLSAELVRLVMAMVDPNPAARPSAAEVIAQLDATPERTMSARLRGQRPPEAMPWIGASAAIAVLLSSMLAFGSCQTQPTVDATPTAPPATVTPLPTFTTIPTTEPPTPLPTSTPALGGSAP